MALEGRWRKDEGGGRGEKSRGGGEACASEGNVLFSPPTGPPAFLGYPSLPARARLYAYAAHNRIHVALIDDAAVCANPRG